MSMEANILAHELAKLGLPVETEYVFHDVRKWRWDIAFPQILLAVEVNGRGRGGRYGGHQTAKGQTNDWEKCNAGVEAGWQVLVYPARHMRLKKDGSPGMRLQNIIDQIYRKVCGVKDDQLSAYVLT